MIHRAHSVLLSFPLASATVRGGNWPVADVPMENGSGRACACIPARDEEQRLPRCLHALDRELDPGDAVILVANQCSDGTAEHAAAMMPEWQRPWVLVDCQWARGHGSAPLARRMAMEMASTLLPDAWLLSTDADTMACPGLRQAYAQSFAQGFDLVCGAIDFIPEEAAALPAESPEAAFTLREYRAVSRDIARRIAPDRDNPWPHHGNIGGANFAIRATAYRTLGGIPDIASGEDRELLKLAQAAGFRVRFSDAARVLTSCRLDGRAVGGLSDELNRNRAQADPWVDEMLEAPSSLLLRHTARRRFLDARERAERSCILAQLGIAEPDADALARQGGGMAWLAAESASPALVRKRLRLSDLQRMLPALVRLRDAIPEHPAGKAAPGPLSPAEPAARSNR